MATYGPFYRTTDTGTSYKWQKWYRQKPITDKPLQYELDYYELAEGSISQVHPWRSWSTSAVDPGSSAWLDLKNKAYQRLVQQVHGVDAQVGATLATWSQTHGMLLNSVNTLLKFTRNLRKGNLVGAARALGMRRVPAKAAVKSFAGRWLEYSFGWKPLIQDIGSAVEVLQGDIEVNGTTCKGRARGQYWSYQNYWEAYYEYYWDARIQLYAKVKINNPNLALANKLGFVNPATVVWEVVPFSFVVDWFIPIGSFLQSFTDFVGYELENTATTWLGDHSVRFVNRPWSPNTVEDWKKRRVQMLRKLEFPSFVLKPRFTGFYSARGANAIALLLQGLRK